MNKKNLWTFSEEGEDTPYLIIENDEEVWESVIDLQEILDPLENDEEADALEHKLVLGIPLTEKENEWFNWLLETEGDELGADVLSCHQWLIPDEEVPVATYKAPESYPSEVFVTLAGTVYTGIILQEPDEEGLTKVVIPAEVKVNIGGFFTEFPEVSVFNAKVNP